MDDIFDDGFRNMHSRVDITANLTMKAVIRSVVKDYFPKLSVSQKELFRTGSFGQFLDIQGTNGDSLLINTMMLHEVRSHALAREGRFGFNVAGISLQYGSMEFCLITGFKFGPFTNLIGATKKPKNSKLRSRLFKDETDQTLRLGHLGEFILGERFSKVPDEDAVMIMQMFCLLRGMLGRELNSCIPPLVFELADNHRNWNRFSWGSFLWSYTEVQMRQIFKKQEEYITVYGDIEGAKQLKYTVLGFMYPFKIWIWETFPESRNFTVYTPDQYPRMRCWRRRAAFKYDECCTILNVSRSGNDPRHVEATPYEMQMPYYIRYLQWINNNMTNSPSPPRSDSEDTLSDREHTSRHTHSRTGESSATGSSSHFSVHMSGDKPAGHTKEKKRSKNPLRSLARYVKNLATQVNLVTEKIDRWDPKFKSQDFSHKKMPEKEPSETFWEGMDNLNQTPVMRTYEKSPTEVVNLGDVTLGPIKTPRPHRHKKASKYMVSPNVQIATTPRLKRRRTKKAISLTLPEREESDQEEAEEVRNRPLLLDIAVSTSGEFWQVWSANIYQLFFKHRFYPEALNWEFWSTLIGVHALGWLEASHVTIWSRLLMEVRPRNGRWTIYPQPITTEPMTDLYMRRVASGIVGGPEWKNVDRVLFPMNVPKQHWFLADFNLRSWKVTIYDSATTLGYFEKYQKDGTFTRFGQCILKELDEIFYWDTVAPSEKKTHIPEFVEAQDVPQQELAVSRGDCGVFVCMFLEMLVSNVALRIDHTSAQSAIMYRTKMANCIWEMRG